MSKIRLVAENMLCEFIEASKMGAENGYYDFYNMGFYNMGTGAEPAYINAWHLSSYKENVSDNTEEWDELEKSIIANLANDVIVGFKGKKVDIIIKKTFD